MLEFLVIFYVTAQGQVLSEYISPMTSCQEWAESFNEYYVLGDFGGTVIVEAKCDELVMCSDVGMEPIMIYCETEV